uniref:Uncharacterized protein n=1 Tax=Melopsittacus undulatus TaxID=13146 RepID=A0A8C6IT55_MELUD
FRPKLLTSAFSPLSQLKGNATINQHVRTISFNVDQVPPGTTCIVKGWSHTSPRATLCEVWVTILKPRQLGKDLSHHQVPTILCSDFPSSSSQGDAGDPLVCNNKAYGIFSYRHKNWPGFYTHIAPFLTWINSVMKSA